VERIARAARVLGIPVPRRIGQLVWRGGVWASLSVLGLSVAPMATAAGQLTSASVSLSDPRPTQASVTYTFTGSNVDGAATIRCVKLIWATSSSNDVAPGGFSGASGSITATSSTLINSSASGWSLAKSDGTSSSGQNNIYEYTNSTGVVPGTTTGATFVAAGLTNPTLADTPYYLQMSTYTNVNCSTGLVDFATTEFINTNASLLSLTVDPTLSFTVNGVNSSTSCASGTTTATTTGTTLPFGTITSGTPSFICQDLAAATNASGGFTIYMRNTGAPSNGIDSINDVSGSNASPGSFPSPGTEAYGYSTTDASLGTGTADRFTNPSQQWAAATTSNAEVAYVAGPVGTTNFFIAHQADVALTTPSGTYTTTVIYTCTPVY
jgi:hypothetical protein